MADWSELPIDILGFLVQHFELMEDYHRFRAVCRSWRSLTPTDKKPKFSLKFPSLLFTEQNEEKKERDLQTRKFYSQLTSQICEIYLPEAACRRCLGIYPGWILTVGLADFQINILNPFTRRQFNLPSMFRFKDQFDYSRYFKPEDAAHVFVKKAVASTSPEQDDCTVLAIYGALNILGVTRLGDKVWRNVRVSARDFNDVVYFKGKFYAVDSYGTIFVCDLRHKNRPTTTIAVVAPPSDDPRLSFLRKKYLVESCGDLYLVSRVRGGYLYSKKQCSTEEDRLMRQYFTTGFYIFRVVRDDGCMRLEDVDDLGDRAFFVGYNASASISSSDCVRANCVYFTDDYWLVHDVQLGGGGHDTGTFDMKTRQIEWHYLSQFQFRSHINPPFWYMVEENS